MSWALRNTLYASGLVIIPYIYIAWRLINSVKLIWPKYIRIIRLIIITIIVWLNSFPILLLYFYSKDTLLDEFIYRNQTNFMDFIFLFPFWIGLILVVEILPYYLASDILQLISKFFFNNFRGIIRKWLAIFKIVIVLLFTIYISYSTF